MDSPHPHQSLERIRGEPLLVALRFEASRQVFDFAITCLLVEIHKNVGITEVTIVFENFVFENQVIAPSVPGQLIDHSMILVEIVTSVRQDQIGRQRVLQFFKVLFDFYCLRREETVAKVEDGDVLLGGSFEKEFGAAASFSAAGRAGAENHPVKFQVATRAKQFEDRAAAANLDIIRMGSETQDAKTLAAFFCEKERNHERFSGRFSKPATARCLWRIGRPDAACL